MKKRTKKQKQKLLLNMLMVGLIIASIVAGALFTAFQKGWFEKSDLQNGDSNTVYHSVVLTTIRGEVSVLRNGISFYPENGDNIMVNDIVYSRNQSTCEIRFDNSFLYLDENTELEFNNLTRGNMTLQVLAGNIIADINSTEEIVLTAGDKHISTTNGYFSLNANGEYSEDFSTSSETKKDKIKKSTDKIKDKKNEKADKKTIKIKHKKGGKNRKPNKATKQTNKSDKNSNNKNNDQNNEYIPTAEPQIDNNTEDTPINSNESSNNGDDDKTNEQPVIEKPKPKPTPSPSPKNICTISIYCDTILDNMDDLAKGKDKYIPENGCILPKTQLTFEEGETAFDILKRACENNNIPLEYSWTPGVNSYYIEGINHLYEFDCGDMSGWLYDVNGKRPIRGCSYYTVNSGDDFLWHYTCSLGT